MPRKISSLVVGLALSLAPAVEAQQWAGIIDPSRAIDWSANNAGVEGGIPNRANLCATIPPYSGDASVINTAIAACGAGQVVELEAGTFNLTTGITFNGRSNVTLRGAGPDKTILVFTGLDGCAGNWSEICMIGSGGWANNFPGGPLDWTGGYSQGTTVLTLAATTGLTVGQIIVLDQLNDPADTGGLWVNDSFGVASIEGSCLSDLVGSLRAQRCQQQYVRVTAINGNNATITPGLYATNWRASQSPQIWWTGAYASQNGLESLTVDATNVAGGYAIISFQNAVDSWVKNVRTLNGTRSHINMPQAAHIEVRDSYFYGTQNAASQSYGIEASLTSDLLAINNIFQHVTTPIMPGGASGAIFAYNYTIDEYVSACCFMASGMYGSHDAGNHMLLFEGNDSNGVAWDTFHGAGGNASTAFRNRLNGWEPNKSGGGTIPVVIWANNRANNIIGNVLGQPGFHTLYQDTADSSWQAIYELGIAAWAGVNYKGVTFDPMVASSLMRWGNYDTVSGAPQWNSAEVPTTGVAFINPNPLPANHNLPVSMLFSTRPAGWWATPWGTPAWPPIGPDVACAGANCIAGVGNFADKIPARLCFENSPIDSNYAVLSGLPVLLFNANRCYGSAAAGVAVLPARPTGLTMK